MKKQWWTSKTLITATSVFLVALGGELFADPGVAAAIEQGLALLTPIFMFVLRLVTKEAVGA
jgi:hypothetical protein